MQPQASAPVRGGHSAGLKGQAARRRPQPSACARGGQSAPACALARISGRISSRIAAVPCPNSCTDAPRLSARPAGQARAMAGRRRGSAPSAAPMPLAGAGGHCAPVFAPCLPRLLCLALCLAGCPAALVLRFSPARFLARFFLQPMLPAPCLPASQALRLRAGSARAWLACRAAGRPPWQRRGPGRLPPQQQRHGGMAATPASRRRGLWGGFSYLLAWGPFPSMGVNCCQRPKISLNHSPMVANFIRPPAVPRQALRLAGPPPA